MRYHLTLPCLLLLGCQPQDVDSDIATPYDTEEQPLQNLDRYTNAASTSYELDMRAGRINKVPVSAAWQGQVSYTTGAYVGGMDITLRARCTSATAPAD